MYLGKRDNMGFALPPLVIVLLIVLSAGFIVICGLGMHRLMGRHDRVEAPLAYRARSDAQESYLREVRDRNVRRLMVEGQRSHMRGGAGMGKRPEFGINRIPSEITVSSSGQM